MKETATPPAKVRLRRLSAEEIDLWLNVTKNVTRRPGSQVPQQAPTSKPGDSTAAKADRRPDTASSRSPAPKPTAAERQHTLALAPIERRLRQKLARGQAAPDAAIDLHGMRRQEAYVALRQFLIRAQCDGARLVLVVTGKGERMLPDGESGILRRNVPQWLHAPDYRSIVVGFEEASRPHGGTGALYVRIRRHDRVDRARRGED